MDLSFFKKKAKEEKNIRKEKEGKEKMEKQKAEPVTQKKIKKGINSAYRILKSLHVTEKATDLNKSNQYVFEVFSKANKPEIKKAIELAFNVEVIGVNIVKIPAKRRRLGKTLGWKKAYKKAIVRIKKGQKIDILAK
jgi:large subunit ribosomal protein L23